jgi:hypothetical protein
VSFERLKVIWIGPIIKTVPIVLLSEVGIAQRESPFFIGYDPHPLWLLAVALWGVVILALVGFATAGKIVY